MLSVLLIGLFLLTACDSEGPVETTGGAFIGGNQGITASFEPLSIIDEATGVYTVYDDEDFPLEIVLQNRGEEDVPVGKATLTLKGPYQGDFENIPSWTLNNKEDIEKISEFNPEGGEEIASFTPNSNALYKEEVIGYNDVTWHLEYNYEYRTHLIVNDVCFNGDLADDTVCKIKGVKSYSVSGAPITVTSVEEKTAGKGVVLLKINLNNVGGGTSTLMMEDYDKRYDQVSYTIDEPEMWECKSGGREGQARLINGQAEIICSLKDALSEDEVYEKSVSLTFEYNYKQSIQEKLRIRETVS